MTLIPKEPLDDSGAAAGLQGPTIPLAGILADFDALYLGLRQAHYDLFARQSQVDYDRLFERTRRGFTRPMPREQVHLAFQKFVAYGRVAHASMGLPQDSYRSFLRRGGKRFPLSVRVLQGRLYVTENHSGARSLAPGAEITDINGEPVSAWLTRLAAYVSADTDYLAWSLVEPLFPFLMWIEAGERDVFVVGARNGSGGIDRKSVAAYGPGDAEHSGTRLHPREGRLLTGGIAYLRPALFFNVDGLTWDTSDFRTFIDGSFDRFLKAGADKLIIDLRDNPGGDQAFSDIMVAWIADRPFSMFSTFNLRVSPQTRSRTVERIAEYAGDPTGTISTISRQIARVLDRQPDGARVPFPVPEVAPRAGRRFTGEVFVLVNRLSYSNATATAAVIQDYGFGRIIGEATADLASGYGASETFVLTNTGLPVTYPKSYFVRPNGDDRASGVAPDFPIATPLTPWSDDRVLQDAARMIAVV
ncbi:S41 family peptidase [Brevundimonas sp. R86498]|uniref:S41 family peptidase n=1 Tax=Brevundimonas sp. R86498 TaxID=3093845 RepID=UPI0037C63351